VYFPARHHLIVFTSSHVPYTSYTTHANKQKTHATPQKTHSYTPRFHVAEDLITTLVTLFIASAAVPALEAEKLQLVFSDDFGMDKNHYTPLYDRMGAWAPRRLTLDPWREGECCESTTCGTAAVAAAQSLV
jgi:hypothetical protein